MTTSAIYNVNRGSSEDPTVTAFDFIRSEESARRKEKRDKARQFIKQVIGQLPMTTTREKFLEVRAKVIVDVKASGCENAEELMDECWPSLKPTKDE